MYSLLNLEKYRKSATQWGGYILECAKEGAIYTGISRNLTRRIQEHMENGPKTSKFIRYYGPPIRVLELYFCQTKEQATQWEAETSKQLRNLYTSRPVYYQGLPNRTSSSLSYKHPYKVILK